MEPGTPRATLLTLLLLSFASSGCGSASASAKAEAGTEKKDAFAVEGDAAWDTSEPMTDTPAASADKKPQAKAAAPAAAPASPEKETALLGARHDVTVTAGTAARCHCLAVVIGNVGNPGLTWSALRPNVDPSSQLVIALSSDQVACDVESPGASYMGYTRDGNNVVIQVEKAHAGRPITHGAIIPKPASGGGVFIESVGKVPYGQGLAGEARCALGTIK